MKKWEPSLKQERFVEALLTLGEIKAAAEQAGVSREAYYQTWRKDPNFMAYLEQKRLEVAGSRLPAVDNALFKKIKEGDTQAMRIFYELFGNLRTGQIVINNQPSIEEEPGKKVLLMLDELEKKQKEKAKLNVVK